MNIIFICTGNTCRSPLAEAHALAMLRKDPTRFAHIQIASAGLFAHPGDPASEGAQLVAKNHGLDLSQHRAQKLTAPHIAASDIIWTMTTDQAAYLASLYPEAKERIESFASGNISDPFGGDLSAYEKAYADIEEAFAMRLKVLAKEK